jgi:hypothetical protein
VVEGFAARAGDCNDFDEKTNPGMPEVCNLSDDNCNNKADEGLPMVTLYRDQDQDGHAGRFTTDTRMHCGALLGYAAVRDDCNDNNTAIYPGAFELCNGRDDNCDGRVDEACVTSSPGNDAGVGMGSMDAEGSTTQTPDGGATLRGPRERPAQFGCAYGGGRPEPVTVWALGVIGFMIRRRKRKSPLPSWKEEGMTGSGRGGREPG